MNLNKKRIRAPTKILVGLRFKGMKKEIKPRKIKEKGRRS